MDEKRKEQIAAFRYSLIAPIVSRQKPMAKGELKAYLEKTAQGHYEIPGTPRNKVSIRSIERYLAMYRKGGWEALKPKTRKDKGYIKISKEVVEKAIALRKEQPERSVEQIIFLLEQHQIAKPGSIALSTLARHLRKAGVRRQDLSQAQEKGYRRFEAEDVHDRWQADAQHTLYLPDPNNPDKRKKAILFAIIDDYSRLIVHAQFYWDEKLPRLEDTLKKAILRHGIPDQFYCDNGAVFSSKHLARICGKLGIQLSHSRPYRPAGRGKIERFFRFIDTSFKPEAYQAIQTGKIQSMEQLNRALHFWIEGYYHLRKHGSTGQTPKERAEQIKKEIRRKSILELNEIFLWEEQRKVDKTGCIFLQGNTYEVEIELAQKTILLRYDPMDLKEIHVYHEEKQYEDAKPLNLKRKYDKRVKRDKKDQKQDHEPSLSFFQAAELKRKQELEKENISFVTGRGNSK